ncbi:MAG: Do family serine endopeptidase [Pseudomonadota bacterium]
MPDRDLSQHHRRVARRTPVRRRWRMAAASVVASVTLLSADVAHACRDTLAPIVEGLMGSVVNIATSQTLKGPSGIPLPDVPKGSPFEEFFREFFDQQDKPSAGRKVNSLGSGFVIEESGLVVTNNHVIKEADEIQVVFTDGSKIKVDKVLGRDPKTDMALLKITPREDKPLTAVRFGDSAKMRVGDCVIAIGNPFGLGGTVTSGIISAKKRDINSGPYDEFIQTDASINKGNSGGPLFNLDGEVIGVNTAIISPTGGSIGIGFAVPSNTASNILNQLRDFGETRRGWLGVRIQSVSEEIAESLGLRRSRGALVADVTKDSPAAKGGLKAGDVILSFDGRDVENMRGLPRIVARTPIGKDVPVIVLRDGERETLTVRTARLTEAQTASTKAGDGEEENAPETAAPERAEVLGLVVRQLDAAARRTFGIADDVEGVLVAEVDAESVAASKGVQAGDVILEVTQKEVSDPADVVSRVEAVRKTGRKSALLLLAGRKGELRFVAVPFGAGP